MRPTMLAGLLLAIALVVPADATVAGTTRIVGVNGIDTAAVQSTATAGTELGLVARVASSALPTGAATSANQATEIASLASIDTNLARLPLAQGSTTSGQYGTLGLAAVTTSAPTYTTGQSAPLSMDVHGALRTSSAVDASAALIKFLVSAGASVEMNVNGSVTPVAFSYTVPALTTVHLTQVQCVILSSSVTASKFGGIAALTNGLRVDIIAADGTTVLLDLTGGLFIKRNSDFDAIGDVNLIITAAADMVSAAWDAGAAFSGVHHLHLTAGQIVKFTVRDDLTALTQFRCTVSGHIEP